VLDGFANSDSEFHQLIAVIARSADCIHTEHNGLQVLS
jgi:hypothetical protein